MLRVVLPIALGAVLVASPPSASARTWKDVQGRTINATFVRVHGLNVVLKRAGRVFSVPLSRLSSQDQQYVRQRLEVTGPVEPAAAGASGANTPGTPSRKSEEESSPEQDSPALDQDEPESPVAATSEPRTWTDVRGSTLRARLVDVAGDRVLLEHGEKIQAFPLAGFSPADQQYIRQALEAGAQDQEDSEPPGGVSDEVPKHPVASGPAAFDAQEGSARAGSSADPPGSVESGDDGRGRSPRQTRTSERPEGQSGADAPSGLSASSGASKAAKHAAGPSGTYAAQDTAAATSVDDYGDGSPDACPLSKPMPRFFQHLLFGVVVVVCLLRLAWIFGAFRRR